MKKTLSLILTICMVFIGVVSFSVPVLAAPSSSWENYKAATSGSTNVSTSSPTYYYRTSAGQYITDVDIKTGKTYYKSISDYTFYWRLRLLGECIVDPNYEYYFKTISVSGDNRGYFLYGTDAQVLGDKAFKVSPWGSNTSFILRPEKK